jgi:phosphate transport system permease protein
VADTAKPQPQPQVEVDLKDLQLSLRRPRTLVNFMLTFMVTLLTLFALLPLGSVLYLLIVRGGSNLNWTALTELPPPPLMEGGGFANAIVGTLEMVGLAVLISVPLGVLGAAFLAEVGPETHLARVVRFVGKVLTGFPSILAGVFAYGAVVLLMGHYSAIAGGIALSILMIPIVLLTAEEAIRMVPAKMREAAIGMGATQTQTIWTVLFPTAFPGMLTGVMLAVARAAGETAPLLFTALFSNYWSEGINQPTASLAVLIYNFAGSPFANQQELAWSAALVLVLLVLTTNLIGQSLSRKTI